MTLTYWLLLLAILFSSLDKWISRAFLRKCSYCNEYLFAYQITCTLLTFPFLWHERFDWRNLIENLNQHKFLPLLVFTNICLWMGFAYATFKARAMVDLSVVSILSRTKLVWGGLIGSVIFNEALSIEKYFGMLLVLLASVLLCNEKGNFSKQSGILYAWLAPMSLVLAISIDKMLAHYLPVSAVLLVGFAGTTLLTPLLLNLHFTLLKPVVFNACLTATCGVISYYLLLTVLKATTFSLTMTLFQCAFLLDILFSLFVLNESQQLKRKISSSLLATIGIYLLVSH